MLIEWKLAPRGVGIPPKVCSTSIASSAPVLETTAGLALGWSSNARTQASLEITDPIPSAQPKLPPALTLSCTAPTTLSAVAAGFCVFHAWR